jgi:hypothetical protein
MESELKVLREIANALDLLKEIDQLGSCTPKEAAIERRTDQIRGALSKIYKATLSVEAP